MKINFVPFQIYSYDCILLRKVSEAKQNFKFIEPKLKIKYSIQELFLELKKKFDVFKTKNFIRKQTLWI